MTPPLDEEIRTWPRGLADIAKLIGPKLAVELGEAVGGVETYIPKHPTGDHSLARVVGLDALKVLAKEYGGQTVVIPRGAHRNLKKAAILQAKGSRKKVALALGCTARYVQKVMNDARPDDGQRDLFGAGVNKD